MNHRQGHGAARLMAALLLIGLMAAAPLAADAQTRGSSATREDGSLRVSVDANYLAPDSCFELRRLRTDPPRGARLRTDARHAVLLVARTPVPCSGQRTYVRRVFSLAAPGPGTLVQLFFVDDRGRLLKSETIAPTNIPPAFGGFGGMRVLPNGVN